MTTNRRLRPYSGVTNAEGPDQALRSWGKSAAQVWVAVLAPSKRAAADAFGLSIGVFNDWMNETGNQATIDALAAYEPGTVLVSPHDPGDTICGTVNYGEWIPRPNADGIAERHRGHVQAGREMRARQAEYAAESDARRARQAETRRRSKEIVAEAQPLLEQLGIRPDTVDINTDGKVAMPSEAFDRLLRLAAEMADMEGMVS